MFSLELSSQPFKVTQQGVTQFMDDKPHGLGLGKPVNEGLVVSNRRSIGASRGDAVVWFPRHRHYGWPKEVVMGNHLTFSVFYFCFRIHFVFVLVLVFVFGWT